MRRSFAMVDRVASVDKESERRLCLLALVAESWQARQGTRDDGGGFTRRAKMRLTGFSTTCCDVVVVICVTS